MKERLKNIIHENRVPLILIIAMIVVAICIVFCPAFKADGKIYLAYQMPYGIITILSAILLIFYSAFLAGKTFLSDDKTASGWWIVASIFYHICIINHIGLIVSSGYIFNEFKDTEDIYQSITNYCKCENIEWITPLFAIFWLIGTCLSFVSFLYYWLGFINCEYHGPALMTLKEKLIEIPIQLALIPVAAIITALSWTIFLMWIPYLLIDKLWFKIFKKTLYQNKAESFSYEYTTRGTVSHQIKDTAGTVIGTFDTTENIVRHSTGHTWGIWGGLTLRLAFFALPLRILTFIVALFAPLHKNLYVHIGDLGLEEETYSAVAFALFDIIDCKKS